MSFNNILIKANIDISKSYININTELTYGNNKIYYNKKGDFIYTKIIILDLNNFIDDLYYYEIILMKDNQTPMQAIHLTLFDQSYVSHKTMLLNNICWFDKNREISIEYGRIEYINFNIKLILKKYSKKIINSTTHFTHLIGQCISSMPYSKKDILLFERIRSSITRYYTESSIDPHQLIAIKIPYIIILYGKNLEIIKNISSTNNIVYQLYKINNSVIIQLKKFVMEETSLCFHKKTRNIDRNLLSTSDELKNIKNILNIHIPINKNIMKKLFNSDLHIIDFEDNISGAIENQLVVYYNVYE